MITGVLLVKFLITKRYMYVYPMKMFHIALLSYAIA